jgi:chromosome segregation ATPase
VCHYHHSTTPLYATLQYKKLLGAKFDEMDDNLPGKLNEIKSELMSIANLTLRCNDLEQSASDKEEELKLLKSSMKFTLIKELQIEAQTYFDEARRLKQILDHRSQQDREEAQERKWAERQEDMGQSDAPEENSVHTEELKDKMQSLEKELEDVQNQINQVDN